MMTLEGDGESEGLERGNPKADEGLLAELEEAEGTSKFEEALVGREVEGCAAPAPWLLGNCAEEGVEVEILALVPRRGDPVGLVVSPARRDGTRLSLRIS